MNENIDDKISEGIEDLKEFYTQKKKEQEALRKLLKALETKSSNEKLINNRDKTK
jgi:hypothetical protein